MKKLLSALIFMGASILATTPVAAKDDTLKLHRTPKLLAQTQLVERSHTSDGSDRGTDGKPRFVGPMGAQAVTYKGYQYAIFYTAKNRGAPGDYFAEVVVGRRPVQAKAWQYSTLPVYRLTSDDAHNRQAIAISKGDGVIHISFDHHNLDRINYAHSAVGVADKPEQVEWNDSVFTFKTNLGFSKDLVGQVTYPKFYSLDSGNLIMYFRKGGATNGEMQIARYDAKAHQWEFIRSISSAEGFYAKNVQGNTKPTTRGPYLAGGGPKFGTDGRMHISWLFREKPENCNPGKNNGAHCNHGIYYTYSDDEGVTWYNNAAQLIADTRKGEVFSIATPGIEALHIPTTLTPSNASHNSAVDNKTGAYHLLLSHKVDADGKTRVHHYTRDSQGNWRKSVSNFSASGLNLRFMGDHLFAFVGRGQAQIYYAERADNFTKWRKLPLPKVGPNNDDIKEGFISWDLSQLASGVVSALWHHKPEANGRPSPITSYDFEIGR